MAIKRNKRFHTEVATSALSDIMFFLLLFFLIISTLANPNVIKIPLPESETTQKAKDKHHSLSVEFSEDQYIYYINDDRNKRIVGDDNELFNQLDSLEFPKDIKIDLYFDKNAIAQKLVDLLFLAKQNNIDFILHTESK